MKKLISYLVTLIAITVIALAIWIISNEIKYTEPKSILYIGKHYCPKCKIGIFADMRTVSKCPTCGYRFWLYSDEVDYIK